MTWFLALVTILYQSVMLRLAGSGFGQRWKASQAPELFYALPIAAANAYAWHAFGFEWYVVVTAFVVSTAIAYAGVQSATWYFLRWESHSDPNTARTSTLKPIVDFIAARFGWQLGDEGYAWLAAGLKGFIIGLPIGGIPLAVLFPLGHEIGTHAAGRITDIETNTVRDLVTGAMTGIAIVIFVFVVEKFFI